MNKLVAQFDYHVNFASLHYLLHGAQLSLSRGRVWLNNYYFSRFFFLDFGSYLSTCVFSRAKNSHLLRHAQAVISWYISDIKNVKQNIYLSVLQIDIQVVVVIVRRLLTKQLKWRAWYFYCVSANLTILTFLLFRPTMDAVYAELVNFQFKNWNTFYCFFSFKRQAIMRRQANRHVQPRQRTQNGSKSARHTPRNHHL